SDRFVRVADGRVAPFGGDLDEYAAWLSSSRGDQGKSRQGGAAQAPAPAVAAPARPPGRVNPRKLAKAESLVGELESRIAAVERALLDPEAYADGGTRAAELGREQAELRSRLEAAEAELLAL